MDCLAVVLAAGVDVAGLGLLSGDILILPSAVDFDCGFAKFAAGFEVFDGSFDPPPVFSVLAVDGPPGLGLDTPLPTP